MRERILSVGLPASLVTCLVLSITTSAEAIVIAYTDETAYKSDLALLGFGSFSEDFESGFPQDPATAASATSQGIQWSSNGSEQITTSLDIVFSGSYGLRLAGADGIGDGFAGVSTGAGTLVGVGGWFTTSTPFAGIRGLLNGQTPVEFGGAGVVGVDPGFFGAIDTGGFTAFEFFETEGATGDVKFLFTDRFTIGIGTQPAPVPEPSTLLLLAAGIIGLIALTRRQARAGE